MNALSDSLPMTEYSIWRLATPLTLGLLIILAGLFWPTLYSMVEVWERSETFTHGFLIFPISAWLIWGRREQLSRLLPQSDWRGLVMLALAGAAWLFADAGSVNVVAQYAFIAMLIAAVWAVLGKQVVWALLFPLMFLFFAVPVGEFLIPPLMEFTANFTVAALQLTGIPVYREGTFFSIPSGDWSVVEGCSGLRYLIASVTLGCLYAYLTYRSWKRRALFTLAAFIVPVFANGGRAYMIVMIAHLSDMKLALGVDHLHLRLGVVRHRHDAAVLDRQFLARRRTRNGATEGPRASGARRRPDFARPAAHGPGRAAGCRVVAGLCRVP